MNIKTILAISALAVFSVAHAKDQPNKATSSAATSQAKQVADQKKPAAAPATSESEKAADGGPRLKKSDKWSR